ncbi:MAG: 50S ribosomal protein L32 [Candidatus Krumholzibacteria bacterium]|jgi:large subunit ribosomal protein L32|nr:50S ribosomal protein L32 [Candidatus Krumholzibacteria bacterium]MDP6669536.1 50S ribosomal protein L32 [Candidatus Krumholzibacteria bacterium]MDP6797640.1 50S ribosomal protein L32 [Candidatus Krumholzibacteria bacterium]MDP7020768.1 50S ribosomal protein L32 [Candidatus Krumholzibacteria bacterium]
MAVPKKRKSRSRSRMTRAVWMASVRTPALVKCSHCGSMKTSHVVCPDCGWYAGRQVLKVETD